MSVQTNIKGVEHKILIRPDKFDSDPFENDSMGKLKANNDELEIDPS